MLEALQQQGLKAVSSGVLYMLLMGVGPSQAQTPAQPPTEKRPNFLVIFGDDIGTSPSIASTRAHA